MKSRVDSILAGVREEKPVQPKISGNVFTRIESAATTSSAVNASTLSFTSSAWLVKPKPTDTTKVEDVCKKCHFSIKWLVANYRLKLIKSYD